jgi:hypothetical protein
MGLVVPAVSVKGMDENWNIRKQRTIVRWAFEKDVRIGKKDLKWLILVT